MEVIYTGDVRQILEEIADDVIDVVVTSPPYFNLRDYGVDGQIGLEDNPFAYIEELAQVFEEIRRVLSPTGSLWLNLGDSYAANRSYQVSQSKHQAHDFGKSNASRVPQGLKAKDLIGIPWRVAFALQESGWWLRSDVIWEKTNALPESVKDRPTRSHEYLFLLTKSAKYYYDKDKILEPAEWARWGDQKTKKTDDTGLARGSSGTFKDRTKEEIKEKFGNTRNARTVWKIPTKPFKGAHFATFPPDLVEKCLLASCPPGGVVLDPFMGSGTTLVVAKKLGLDSVGIELNTEYVKIAEERLALEVV